MGSVTILPLKNTSPKSLKIPLMGKKDVKKKKNIMGCEIRRVKPNHPNTDFHMRVG